MLYPAKELNYLSESEFNSLLNNLLEISKALSGLIKTLRTFELYELNE